jgi:hypothetical protein
MQEEMASFGRESTIIRNRGDLSIISRSREQNVMAITDLRLDYENQLEKL